MADELMKPAEFEQMLSVAKSGEEPKPEGEAPAKPDETDPKETDAPEVKALKAELKRVRASNRDATKDSEITDLKVKLANIEGQVNAAGRRSQVPAERQWSDSELIGLQADWEEVLAADPEKRQMAKDQLKMIRSELYVRSRHGATQAIAGQIAQGQFNNELASLYVEAQEKFPDLKDKTSALWQAAKTEYDKRPALMRQLGPLADSIAVAMALANRPDLAGKAGDVKARKELIKNIEQTAESALHAGAGSAQTKVKADFSTLAKTDRNAFEDLVQKAKSGKLAGVGA